MEKYKLYKPKIKAQILEKNPLSALHTHHLIFLKSLLIPIPERYHEYCDAHLEIDKIVNKELKKRRRGKKNEIQKDNM